MPTPHLTLHRPNSMAGRPLKFGEPLVRREFKLPESLSKRLTRVCQNKGVDASDYAREGIAQQLDLAEGLRETEVKEAVREAFEEIVSNRLSVDLDDEGRKSVEAIAAQLGFYEASRLMKSLALAVINDPEMADEFLRGKLRTRVQSDLSAQSQAA